MNTISLKDVLLEDMKTAMREKDTIRKDTVQLVRAAILQVEKDNKVTLNDDEIIGVVAKELKKRRDVLPDYEKSNRQDLIDKLNKEIEILMGYLPQQLSEAEVEDIVKVAVEEIGASSMKDMGKVMAAVRPKTNGRADGKLVNNIVKKYLS